MKNPIRFILIDDDFVSNFLSTIFIESVTHEVEITPFENAQTAFEYIKKQYVTDIVETVLFLDINMPDWSGWDFLDNFERLDKPIKNKFSIYMLSSSLDPCDQQKAFENKNVVDYIEKPLSEEIVLSVLTTLNQMV